jgi:1-phosphofructokinase family hexose kinase
MILTVTANTALDEVLEIERFVAGERLRILDQAECISGKGTLVSAFAADFGQPSVALGFAAGRNGRLLAQLLRRRGVRVELTPAKGETRRITVLVDHSLHQQTWLLPEGLQVTRANERDLERRLTRWLPKARWLALCGSLAPGCSPLLYQRLVRRAKTQQVPVLIDSRGAGLAHALAGQPAVVKQNRRELEATFGESISTEAAMTTALRRLIAEGVELAVCTLGAQGALALTSRAGWRLFAPRVQACSSAGSGDAFAAALLVERVKGAEWPEALRWATAAGTAKALEARTDSLDPHLVPHLLRRVRLRNL